MTRIMEWFKNLLVPPAKGHIWINRDHPEVLATLEALKTMTRPGNVR